MLVGIEGAALWVEEEGDGPPLMVPSGAGVEFYRRTLSRRLRTSFHVFFVEMRGTGGSTGTPGQWSFASMADDLEAVRVGLGLGPVAVLGQSNHGCIAVEHGLRHAEGNSAVVSVASVLDARGTRDAGLARWRAEATPEQKADLRARMQAFADDDSPMSRDERAVRNYLSVANLGWMDPDSAHRYWGGTPFGAGAYFEWLGEAMVNYDASDRIRTLRSPLLAVCGKYDYLCPVTSWDAVRDMPNARVEVFGHSAHNPQVEEQERFDEVVFAFLGR